MKIECILQRKGGTRVNLGGVNVESHVRGGKNYHFTPGQDAEGNDLPGPHLCDVRDQGHVAQLLAIPAGFQIHDPDGDLIDTGIQVDNAGVGVKAIAGTQVKDSTADAGKEPAGSVAPDPAAKYNALGDAELAEEFNKKAGKKPHPNAKRDSIVRALVAIDEKAALDTTDKAAA